MAEGYVQENVRVLRKNVRDLDRIYNGSGSCLGEVQDLYYFLEGRKRDILFMPAFREGHNARVDRLGRVMNNFYLWAEDDIHIRDLQRLRSPNIEELLGRKLQNTMGCVLGVTGLTAIFGAFMGYKFPETLVGYGTTLAVIMPFSMGKDEDQATVRSLYSRLRLKAERLDDFIHEHNDEIFGGVR